MQDFPTSAELLEALAAYLFGDVRPLVPREERFRVLVAANICAVVAREIRAGASPTRPIARPSCACSAARARPIRRKPPPTSPPGSERGSSTPRCRR